VIDRGRTFICRAHVATTVTERSGSSESGRDATSDASRTALDGGLRVVTYNVRYSGLDDGTLAWPNRVDGVAARLSSLDPDLVGLQECWLDMLDDLRERLPFGWVAERDGSGEHTPVAYRADRFERVAGGRFQLSETPSDRGSVGWDAALPRVAHHATYRDTDGRRVRHVNVHFDHAGETARLEGARLVSRWLADRAAASPVDAVVVTGDLNCRPGSPPHALLTGTEARRGETAAVDAVDGAGNTLRDAREDASEVVGPSSTYTGFEAPRPGRILDHVFTAGARVRRYRVVPDRDGGERSRSDHLPVVVDLSIGD
jgi:endonuclease/exonuclease/phosphatase family metal-dependent hydrolase